MQLAQTSDRLCVAAFFDGEGQAAALGDALEQVRQEAEAANAELEQVLQQQIGERRQQVLLLLADEELLNSAISTEQISPEQAEQLERFRNDLGALDDFLEEQVAEARQIARADIEQRRIAIESEINETASQAANFQTFQGITSIAPTSLPGILTTSAADIILLPQTNGLLLMGEPSRLVNYVPVDESEEDVPDLLDSADMQACLATQDPFRVDF